MEAYNAGKKKKGTGEGAKLRSRGDYSNTLYIGQNPYSKYELITLLITDTM
jgi:hypothetical protein